MKKLLFGIFITVMLVGCSEVTEDVEEEWKVSTTFEIPVTFEDGTAGEYILIGKKDKLGFLVGSGKEGEAEAQPIIKEKQNKYMWHFWG